MANFYATAIAFRAALEARLNQQARDQGTDIMRLRRTVAFERFLARLFADENPPWLLKGGYSLELRLPGTARATKDIDLTVPNLTDLPAQSSDHVLAIREALQQAVAVDLGDWFSFRVGSAMIEIDAAPYGGAQYPVEGLLANRLFARFHVDVGVGDAVISPPDQLIGHPLLDFIGIPPLRVAALPVEQHFAEKIHAYTFDYRDRTNGRVKDLVDLVLLMNAGLPPSHLVAKAVRATFERRNTHSIPKLLPPPPESWPAQFAALAAQTGSSVPPIDEAYALVSAYWETLDFPP